MKSQQTKNDLYKRRQLNTLLQFWQDFKLSNQPKDVNQNRME